MFFVDDILYEFGGQLSINDIYNLTYKELGYLREHRHQLLRERQQAQEEAIAKMNRAQASQEKSWANQRK